jgi:amidohydrolase
VQLARDPEWVSRSLDGVVDRMVDLRRDIHAHPELAWHEVRTSAMVTHELVHAGLAPTPLPAGTGLVCDIVGEARGPTVALRADLDALPIDDEKDVPYRSSIPGVAHACGHDVHTAVVLGAGLGLARLAAAGELAGRVRLVFQPAEEVLPGGALAALAAGALEGAGRVFALHCDPHVDAGSVAVRVGPITAAMDSITVRLSGPGGHTARPQLTVDLVAALADVVVRTPALLSRRVDPRAGLSLVWGSVTAGSADNVIPPHGEAAGTVRVLDPSAWASAAELIPRLIEEIAAPYQAQVDIDYRRGVPPAVNDPKATEAFRAAAAALLGPVAVPETPQSMGAEDFAWYLDRVPGVMGRLGVRRPGTLDAPDLHCGDFDVDEAAIGCGARVLVAAAMSALRDPRLRAAT